MTSRERLLCAMQGGEPDRVPVAPFGLGHINPDSDLGAEMLERTDLLVDAGCGMSLFVGPDAQWEHQADGSVTTHTLHTPKGPLVRRVQRTAVTSATVQFPFESAEDVDRFLSVPWRVPTPDLSHYFGWCERAGDNGLVLAGIGNAICLAAEWFSPEAFAVTWADDPALMVRLTEVASDRLNACVETLCEAGVRAFRIVGGEYVSVQLGPRAFKALVTPFDTALVEIMHRHGAIAYYHNHGRVSAYIEDLAALGIDALDPLEAPPWGNADLREARRRAGDRLCFCGNLDDMEVVDALPREVVLAIARERLAAGGRRAFILGGTASGSYGENGARNFIAMAEMVSRGQ